MEPAPVGPRCRPSRAPPRAAVPPCAGRPPPGRRDRRSPRWAAASTSSTVDRPPSSARTGRPSEVTAPASRDRARQWKASSQADRHSGAYVAGTASTAAVSSSAGSSGEKQTPSGSASAMSSTRVSRASWRSVTARCLRTSTAEAVGRLEKSLGQTRSTRWRTRGAGSSRAATRSRASTYTAACRRGGADLRRVGGAVQHGEGLDLDDRPAAVRVHHHGVRLQEGGGTGDVEGEHRVVEQRPGPGRAGGLPQGQCRPRRAALGAGRGQVGHLRAGGRFGAPVQLLVHEPQQLGAAVRLDPRLEGVAPHERELRLPEDRRRTQRARERGLVHSGTVEDRAPAAPGVGGEGGQGPRVQRLGRYVGTAQLSEPVPESRPPRPLGRGPARLLVRTAARAAVGIAHPRKSGIHH